MQKMIQDGISPDIHTYTSFVNACSKAGDMNRAMAALEEMASLGMKPNIKTHTALINGWALASYPDKALMCFEEMKQAGLEPDQAVYHCLMTSLLSRATVAKNCVYTGILRISKEMSDLGFSVDLETAVHWSKSLRRLEAVPAQLTNAVEKVFPPSWYSYKRNHENLDTNDDMDSDEEDGAEFEVLDESLHFGPLE